MRNSGPLRGLGPTMERPREGRSGDGPTVARCSALPGFTDARPDPGGRSGVARLAPDAGRLVRVGAVLVEALLLIPAAAARNVITSMRGFVLLSMAISTVSCIAGVILPMQFDLPLPSGGAIIMVAATFFVLTTIIRVTLSRFREATV